MPGSKFLGRANSRDPNFAREWAADQRWAASKCSWKHHSTWVWALYIYIFCKWRKRKAKRWWKRRRTQEISFQSSQVLKWASNLELHRAAKVHWKTTKFFSRRNVWKKKTPWKEREKRRKGNWERDCSRQNTEMQQPRTSDKGAVRLMILALLKHLCSGRMYAEHLFSMNKVSMDLNACLMAKYLSQYQRQQKK